MKLAKIIKMMHNNMESQSFIERFRARKQDFTRKRKVGFAELMLFVLVAAKESLNLALFNFGGLIKIETGYYTKQAFSKARLKILPEAFKTLFKESVRLFYEDKDFHTLHGYRILAVDGSKVNLPISEDMKSIYGCQKSSGGQPQALVSCLYDVLNGIILDAIIAPHNANERTLCVQHLDELANMRTVKELVLVDRGYPSAELICEFDKRGVNYLMRCSKEFINAMKLKGGDCTINHRFHGGQKCRLRVVQITLPGKKEPEILVTNLFSPKLTFSDFADLYHLRWNIEEKYNDLKNKLELENFSGTSNIAVLQDFYAALFLNNIVAAVAYENQAKIDALHKDKMLKYEYKTNFRIASEMLRMRLIEIYTIPSERKRRRMIKAFYDYLQLQQTPIHPGRSSERSRKHSSHKFPSNLR